MLQGVLLFHKLEGVRPGERPWKLSMDLPILWDFLNLLCRKVWWEIGRINIQVGDSDPICQESFDEWTTRD